MKPEVVFKVQKMAQYASFCFIMGPFNGKLHVFARLSPVRPPWRALRCRLTLVGPAILGLGYQAYFISNLLPEYEVKLNKINPNSAKLQSRRCQFNDLSTRSTVHASFKLRRVRVSSSSSSQLELSEKFFAKFSSSDSTKSTVTRLEILLWIKRQAVMPTVTCSVGCNSNCTWVRQMILLQIFPTQGSPTMAVGARLL